MNTTTVLAAYQDVKIESGVTGASAHQLVLMLLDGAIDKLTAVEAAIDRNDISARGQVTSSVISIVDSLRASVNQEEGGELASNLVALYDYMEQRLLEANIHADAEIVAEVKRLLKEIQAAWSEIPEDARVG